MRDAREAANITSGEIGAYTAIERDASGEITGIFTDIPLAGPGEQWYGIDVEAFLGRYPTARFNPHLTLEARMADATGRISGVKILRVEGPGVQKSRTPDLPVSDGTPLEAALRDRMPTYPEMFSHDPVAIDYSLRAREIHAGAAVAGLLVQRAYYL